MYCLTELYDGRDMYRTYYIKNNYMFWHFTLAIFRLRNEKNFILMDGASTSIYNHKVRHPRCVYNCCSLCNKFYTYLYHHIVVLDKYIHSSLV